MTPRLQMALSLVRLLVAAALLCLVFLGLERPTAIAFAAALAIDVAMDNLASSPPSGWIARAGAWSDLATRAAVPLALYSLRPYLLETEPVSFWTIVAAFAMPVAYSFVKYGRVPRYQTRAAVIAVYLVGASTVFLLVTGATWPLRLAAGALVVAQLEEMAVTTLLPAPQAPIRSLRAALRLRSGRL